MSDKTLDLTPQSGMSLRSLSKQAGSPFLMNVLPRNGEFLVRPGFGLVREYGTTQNCGRQNYSPDRYFGLGPPIGKIEVRTSWGADQLVVIHPLYSFTGDLRHNSNLSTVVSGTNGQMLAGVSAVVHDLNSGKHVEFVLHYQDTERPDLRNAYPHYSTRFGTNNLRWAVPTYEPKWAIGLQFNTMSSSESCKVLIAIDGMFVWTYRPVDITGTIDRKNDSLNVVTLPPAAGELCAFSRMAMSNGIGAAKGVQYILAKDFNSVDCMGFYGGRVVFARGSRLFFSDLDRPDNIVNTNYFDLPSNDPVTALAQVYDGLMISTAKGTWLGQVIDGNEITTIGRLHVMSSTTGVVTNQSWVSADNNVYGVDNSGVFLYKGGLKLSILSEDIDRLWTDPQGLQMVLTDYYVKSGFSALGTPQLPAYLNSHDELQTAKLSWSQDFGCLFVTCKSFILVWFKGFGWTLWYLSTHAGSFTAVQGMANIANPLIATFNEKIYLVGGADETTYVDNTDPYRLQLRDSSCYLLQLGRGGAIDRSTTGRGIQANVYKFVPAGLWGVGDKGRITLNGVNYDYTVSAADLLVDEPMDRLATQLAFTVGAGVFTATPAGNVVTAIETTPAGAVLAGSSSVLIGSGTLTTTTVHTGAYIDVSEATLEDQREPNGGYVEWLDRGSAPTFWIGRQVEVAAGYKTPLGNTLTVPSYWVPVSLGNLDANLVPLGPPTIYGLSFAFDNTVWRAICTTNPGLPGELDYILPAERCASEAGYSPGAMVPARHAWCYDTATAAASNTGNTIDITFNATLVAAPNKWDGWPQLNLGVVGPNQMIWIGFTSVQAASATPIPLTSLHIATSVIDATVQDAVAQQPASVYVWQQGAYPIEHLSLAAKQQPVDWAVKSVELNVKDQQLRVRGVYLTAMHLGNGNDDVVQNWIYGPLNTATSTDMRDYSGQSVDFVSTPPGNSQQTDIAPRARMRLTSGGDPTLKTFGAGARWGDSNGAGAGNLLIDDAAVDTLGTSDGSQGVRASILTHGTMNAPGESVRLGKIAAVVRLLGGLRRWHA